MTAKDLSIMLVDDEPIIVETLVTFLEQKGYRVEGLTNASEALNKIKEEHYDIVLTDLKMPVVTGIEIVRAVIDSGHDTKVIIFTGYASLDSAIEAVKLGVYDYIQKPFKPRDIEKVINHAGEELLLKRENIALHRRIENMLNDITLLYDISSILYQVTDFDASIDMILDTITEGMKITQAGLLFKQSSGNVFRFYKYRGLSDSFIKEFQFRLGDTINSVPVVKKDLIQIKDLDTYFQINDTDYTPQKDISTGVLVPIHFLDEILGYIGLFRFGQWKDFDEEDQRNLYQILATQIAPILYYTRLPRRGKGKTQEQKTEHFLSELIEQEIASRGTVTFALLRLVFREELRSAKTMLDYFARWQETIRAIKRTKMNILFQSLDTGLLVASGGDRVSMDLACAKLKLKTEEAFLSNGKVPPVTMEYSVVSYPVDGNSPVAILGNLSFGLFNALIKETSNAN